MLFRRATSSLAPKVFNAASTRFAPAAASTVGNHSFLNFFSSGIKADFPEDISEEQVRKLFYVWNDALATLDPKEVANRYSSDPILLPTVSDTPRTDYAGLEDYFKYPLCHIKVKVVDKKYVGTKSVTLSRAIRIATNSVPTRH